MTKLLLYVSTIFKLGIRNVAYVVWYRITLKSGIRKLWFPVRKFSTDHDYFIPCKPKSNYPKEWKQSLIESANKIKKGTIRYYAYHWKNIGDPPDWFLNPFTGTSYPDKNEHWTKLPDFSSKAGDIKNIWEASRFEWVITLARAYRVTGNEQYLTTLNKWLRDWAEKNPLNRGPNWKCGQEASIRVFNLVNATYILDQYDHPTQVLTKFIASHLEHISKNILYAIAQDNNHGTSEAAGLFIGGSWLFFQKTGEYPKAKYFVKKGRKWLGNRVNKLVEVEGSFSQHSVNYHRVLLDTLSFVEIWRKLSKGKEFSQQFYHKTQSAINWLWQLTDKLNGNAPNLGANDGALLNNLNQSIYRDFRPTLQLSSVLFLNKLGLPVGNWDEPLWWFDLKTKRSTLFLLDKKSSIFNSGYVLIHSTKSWALIRFPYFRFRPSHNDVFHLDLWYNGNNILCDAGSYSYNPVPDNIPDLKSIQSHNTVCFDGYEQMPKLGRFLMGSWLKPQTIGEINKNTEGYTNWEGAYIDNNKNRHQRKISVKNNIWIIEDTLSGNFKEAVIGFNIKTTNVILNLNQLQTPFGLIVTPDMTSITLADAFMSEYYHEKQFIKRLNITVDKPGTYKTVFYLKDENSDINNSL